MNYLAHLYLADYTGTSPAGSVLGDAVKGRLRGDYPPAIEQGIRLHRRVDQFTDSHPVVLTACARFQPPYRRYAGILLDIYFDHILANHWRDYHSQTLARFARNISEQVWHEWPHPPFTARRMSGFSDVLSSYAHPDGIKLALTRVSARAKRANPIANALPLLQEQHDEIASDFAALFPALIKFSSSEVQRSVQETLA